MQIRIPFNELKEAFVAALLKKTSCFLVNLGTLG